MIDAIFGYGGKHLGTAQMAARAFVIFFIAIALVRIGGMRAFSRKSSFDIIILVNLGAVMSRAIYGASPAAPILAASLVLVVVHRVVAIVAARVPHIERLVKGRAEIVYREGVFDYHVMSRAGISRADLEEAVRKAHHRSLPDVHEIQLEASGDLTVVGRDG